MVPVVVNAHLEAQEVPGAVMDMTGTAVIAIQEEAPVEELILVAGHILEVARTQAQAAVALIQEVVTMVAVILGAIIAGALQEAVVILHQLVTTRQPNRSLFLNQHNNLHPRL